jgi:hypothetical protein
VIEDNPNANVAKKNKKLKTKHKLENKYFWCGFTPQL